VQVNPGSDGLPFDFYDQHSWFKSYPIDRGPGRRGISGARTRERRVGADGQALQSVFDCMCETPNYNKGDSGKFTGYSRLNSLTFSRLSWVRWASAHLFLSAPSQWAAPGIATLAWQDANSSRRGIAKRSVDRCFLA
jgi:hypothetical protein